MGLKCHTWKRVYSLTSVEELGASSISGVSWEPHVPSGPHAQFRGLGASPGAPCTLLWTQCGGWILAYHGFLPFRKSPFPSLSNLTFVKEICLKLFRFVPSTDRRIRQHQKPDPRVGNQTSIASIISPCENHPGSEGVTVNMKSEANVEQRWTTRSCVAKRRDLKFNNLCRSQMRFQGGEKEMQAEKCASLCLSLSLCPSPCLSVSLSVSVS